jgi:uncharacterized membrane protein
VGADRSRNVDLLRGIVMILMALDHARDFVMGFGDPTDLKTTTVPLFLTRWITHYCAPVFVFLAGTGAYLSGSRGRGLAELRHFLWTRGLWLIVVEVTIVRAAWFFDLSYRFSILQVIWAIGWSMIVLAMVVGLPSRAIGGIGVTMIVLHNLLDRVQPPGQVGWVWAIFHKQQFFEPIAGHRVFVVYPLVPWIGVMMAGYAAGAWMGDAKKLLRAGAALTIGFVVLRWTNVYGDPTPWSAQKDAALTVLSFLNCQKYPPSLCYLLMTLGPAFLLLAALLRARGPVADLLVVYGRVPFFYYVLHIVLIHSVALALPREPASVHGLVAVYVVWSAAVVALFFPCRRYAQLKQEKRSWTWLSYI